MINEPNSHNNHQQHEELETDTLLPLEFEALAARLAADGAVWQSRLPDSARVAERIRTIPHQSLRTASALGFPIIEDTTSLPEISYRAPHPDDRQRKPPSPWGRFLGLAAAAIVVALLATVLVQLANQRGRTTGPTAPKATAQTQPTATTVPATATPTHPAGPVVTGPIVGSTMFSATSGWGSVQTGSNPNIVGRIAYTVNGGHTWYDVTPAGLTGGVPSDSTIALYPRSATEAWTWLASLGGSSTTLWHTTDAGAHWSTSTAATGAVRQLDFTDSLHGWLTAIPGGGAAGEYPINVWRTTDGGVTWAKVGSYLIVGSDATAGISFVTATTGFATSAAGLLVVTHDGGVTWTPVSLPVPSTGVNLTISTPVFTSATAGVVAVTSSSVPSSPATLKVYHTTDAGMSWQLGPSLSGIGGTSVPTTSVPSSVLSTGDVFAAVTVNGQVTLYQLPVGATSWTKINTGSSSTALLSGITRLDFVNQTTGWAVTQAGLIGTTDGGVTWTLLHV
jgi:photosystem II stability/assembly factor-like uncharacterized protein